MAVEVCLKDAAGVAAFKQEMQAIARSHELSLVDDSIAAERNVDAVTNPEFRKKLGRPVVSMVANHGDSVIVIIGNIGLPSGQVALGFFDGSTAFDSRQFAQMVVKRLATKWQVEVVPQGQGAQGIESCT
ncbi:MAG: hypothetical protein ACRETY_00295 [Steroidobacteraceae bacterium]